MKRKYLFIGMFLLFMINSNAQQEQLSNNSFESWLQEQIISLQDYFDSADEGRAGITKESDAYSGNYSVKLQTSIVAQDTMFGYFINFDPDGFTGGAQYTSHVDSIVGYYKAGVVAQDTAWILTQFKFNSTPIGGGLKGFTQLDNTNTWTRFKINTNMPSGVVPDTLMFGAVSSNALNDGPNNGVANGSWLQLDNIKFYANGVETTPMANNDFENWDNRTIEKPENYDSSLLWDITSNPLSVEKITDATDGQYAIKLNNVVVHNDTIHAAITNGRFTHDWPPAGGLHITQIPDSITYDVKVYRTPSPSGTDDNAYVTFYFKNQGNVINVVGETYDVSTQGSGYKHERLDVDFNQNVDTLLFTLFNGRMPGSYTQLDNILLHYHTGNIGNLQVERLVVFPNPADNILQLRFNALKPDDVTIMVMDMQGKIIKRQTNYLNTGNNDISIDISGLSKGNYIFSIKNKEGSLSKTFIKK